MSTLLDCCIGSHRDQVDLTVRIGSQYDHTICHLILQLISQITQTIHIYAVYSLCQELYALHFFDIVIHTAQCRSGRLAL